MRRPLQFSPRILAAVLLHAICKFWWYLRQVSGDAAYENYRSRYGAAAECARTDPLDVPRRSDTARENLRCASKPFLSRSEFYLETIERRYSGISRCC